MTSSKTTSTRKFLLQLLVIFIVVVAGVVSGLMIGSKLGISGKLGLRKFTPETMENRTRIRRDEPLPALVITNSAGRAVDLDSLTAGSKAILGVVSSGCEPCLTFVESFSQAAGLPDTPYRVVFLSTDPGYFSETYSVTAYQVAPESLDEYGIHSFPTIIGVSENGIVRFVFSGYSTRIDADVLKEFL